MTKLQIHYGETFADAKRRILDAVARAENGPIEAEEHVSFAYKRATPLLIDEAAKEIAFRRWVLPECLHVPIAARDEAAIQTYIGDIFSVIAPGTPNQALLVVTMEPPVPDLRLPIWQMPASSILHHRLQLWVHVRHRGYRKSYQSAFPDEHVRDRIMGHILNRRLAELKGFDYVRLVPISREANSSSSTSENWGIGVHKAAKRAENSPNTGPFIQYADLPDLVELMDIQTGGGLMDVINDAQDWVKPAAS
jgi:hypothetical protein